MIGKRKLAKVNQVSVMYEVLGDMHKGREIQGQRWFDCSPDMWNAEERKLYDMLMETEHRLKAQINSIIQPEPKG